MTGLAQGPSHHIPDVVLMDYAAGNVQEALALLVATHLAMCPACRTELREIELIGGALLQELDTAAVVGELPMSEPFTLAPEPATRRSAESAMPIELPRPLRDYVGGDLAALDWRSGLRGVQECVLGTGPHGIKSALLCIQPGRQVPNHTHMGDEYTLVLQGGFSDQAGQYLPGDVAVADSSVTHRPVADAHEPCLCLTATDAPLQLTGPIGWLVNPFLRR
ncbi:MAG: ChrR family anti-sigma-E factor [Alphaproteobacteria bacterium]